MGVGVGVGVGVRLGMGVVVGVDGMSVCGCVGVTKRERVWGCELRIGEFAKMPWFFA